MLFNIDVLKRRNRNRRVQIVLPSSIWTGTEVHICTPHFLQTNETSGFMPGVLSLFEDYVYYCHESAILQQLFVKIKC